MIPGHMNTKYVSLKKSTMKTLTVKNGQADLETGLTIQQSFEAVSGFKYQTGVREFGSLKILEGVSKGSASNIFLCSLLVFDEENVLLFDAEIKKHTNYSRELARLLVREGLMKMLEEAAEKQNKFFDRLAAYKIVDAKLKDAYYSMSYEKVIIWGEKLGITFTSF